MTLVFQIAAGAAIVVAGFFFLRAGGARHQAIRRVLALLFVVGAVASLFFPQALTWVANLVGIGRGADLLTYLVVLAFIGFSVTTFRRFRQLEAEQTALARKLALLEAPQPPESDAQEIDSAEGD